MIAVSSVAAADPAGKQGPHNRQRWERGRVASGLVECMHACLRPALQSRRWQAAGRCALGHTARWIQGVG